MPELQTSERHRAFWAGHVSVRGASAALGLSPETILRYVRLGMLRGYVAHHRHYTDERPRKTRRGTWRVSVESIVELLEKAYGGSRVPPGVIAYLRRKAKSPT